MAQLTRLRSRVWPYGREKAYVERMLDLVAVRNPSLRVVRMRPAFIFQRTASSEQRRIFAGPFVPGLVAERGLLPVLPFPRGLQFQALHADDAALAYHLAVHAEVEGAFNLAAEPPLDADRMGHLLDARPVEVNPWLVRQSMAAAWRAHLIPAEPALFDLVETLPLLDTSRARDLLGWEPDITGPGAIAEMLAGLRDGAGGATPPLEPDSARARVDEVATGVGAEN